jgi:4'-phosphopantetheinyl transferase
VWQIDLREPCPDMQQLTRMLSECERTRANRVIPARDRDRFVAVHAAVRGILDRYLCGGLGRSEFDYGPYGKPELQRFGCPSDCLTFNLSHSQDVALCAIALGRRVGVDAEYRRAGISIDKIAEQICSPTEYQSFTEIPSDQRETAFFQCWARKEACAKATGVGLTVPLRRWDVGWAPKERACQVWGQRSEEQESVTLTVCNLMLGPGYAAALAAEGTGWALACWRWTWDCPGDSSTRKRMAQTV